MQTNWTTFLRDGPSGVKNIGGMDVLIFLFSSKRIWNIKTHLKQSLVVNLNIFYWKILSYNKNWAVACDFH